MAKEEEIREMTKEIVAFKVQNELPLGVGIHSVELSKHLVEAGYRKAADVRKEVIKEVVEFMEARSSALNNLFGANTLIIDDLAEEIEKEFLEE